jgi:hypothetical protein
MHAVNSAICPEVENYESTSEIGKRYRRLGVEPFEIFWKLRGVDRALILRCHSLRLSPRFADQSENSPAVIISRQAS